MKVIFYIIALISTLSIYAQEFSFNMYFEDAMGKKDTLAIGYDSLATDNIDTAFGEINIITIPWDTVFEVRITNDRYSVTNDSAGFHTKKQIMPYNCNDVRFYPGLTIDIKAKHWPVTATWDKTLFWNSCREGSYFANIPSIGWDIENPKGPWHTIFQNQNQYTFNTNISYPTGVLNDIYAYANGNGDTLSVYWIRIGDSKILGVGIDEINNSSFKVYPNPVSDYLNIDLEINARVDKVRLINLNGEALNIERDADKIDLSNLSNGLYILEVSFSNGQTQTKKIIKTSR